MAHNLFGNRFIEAQGGQRQRAWHRIGMTFTEALTAEEALVKAKADVRLAKRPLLVNMGAPGTSNCVIPSPDLFAIVRDKTSDDPEYRIFGTVGKSYQLLQSREICQMVDRMSALWHVETLGLLGQGETLFLAMAAGQFDIDGDVIENYVTVSDTRNGSGGVTFLYSPIRVVCQNTFNLAMSSATSRVTLSHSSAVRGEMNELMNIYAHLEKTKAEGQEALRQLVKIKVNFGAARDLIGQVYLDPPMPAKVRLAQSVDGQIDLPLLNQGKKGWEAQIDQVRVFRAKAEDLFDNFNDRQPKHARTGYALYNAITEHVDHYMPSRSAETGVASILFGERAGIKASAFDLISKLG